MKSQLGTTVSATDDNASRQPYEFKPSCCLGVKRDGTFTGLEKIPKEKYYGKKTAKIAVALVVLQFHKGAGALAAVVDSLGASPGTTLLTVASTIDATNRKRKAMEKIKQEQHRTAAEGRLYEADGH